MAAEHPPTHERYWVVVCALWLAVLSYIDRVALSQAAPRVQRDLGLTDQDMGHIFGAFGLAYALFEIPGGFLGDWLGPKKVLIRIVLWWSFFTAGDRPHGGVRTRLPGPAPVRGGGTRPCPALTPAVNGL